MPRGADRRLRRLFLGAVALVAAAPVGAALAVEDPVRLKALSEDWSQRWDAVRPLAKEGSVEAAKLLGKLLGDTDPRVRDHASDQCYRLRTEDAVAHLVPWATKGPPATRAAAVAGISRTGTKGALETLLRVVRNDWDADVRAEAAEGLGEFPSDPTALEACAAASKDRDPLVRAAALVGANSMKDRAGRSVVVAAMGDRDDGVRAAALQLLWTDDAAIHVEAAASDASWRVRTQCAQTCGALRSAAAVDILLRLLPDRNDRVAAAAARSLRLVSGKDFGRDAELWSAWWKQARPGWKPPVGTLKDPRTADGPGTKAQFMGIEIEGECIAFVLDFSTSMLAAVVPGTTRHQLVQAELAKTLAALPDGHRVCVITFGERVRQFARAPTELTPKSRAAIAAWAAAQPLEAHTNFFGGIATALADDRVDAVYLLSDGSPTIGDVTSSLRVRTVVRRMNRTRKVSIHAVGIGVTDTYDREFLTLLAERNGGTAVFR